MKATEAPLLAFLKKSPQFVIPIYQRTYSWTEKECRQLWDDIVRCGSNDKIAVHFVGSIVYVEKGLYSVSSQSPLLVIDGQQRLATPNQRRHVAGTPAQRGIEPGNRLARRSPGQLDESEAGIRGIERRAGAKRRHKTEFGLV